MRKKFKTLMPPMIKNMRLEEILFVLPDGQTPIIAEPVFKGFLNYEVDPEGNINLNVTIKVKTRKNLYGYWNLCDIPGTNKT